jgi:transcription elongation GreA/GreB family factor
MKPTAFNKQELIAVIREQLTIDLEVQFSAARATLDAATNEESKPENEYDTRGLEASYLAGAQGKRINEIQEQLTIYKFLQVRDFAPSDAISTTAVVGVECDGKPTWLFLVTKGGGLSVRFQDRTIQTITAQSPLGEALIGLKMGDTAIVEQGGKIREYDILTVL